MALAGDKAGKEGYLLVANPLEIGKRELGCRSLPALTLRGTTG